jgi:hypothetical protein
MAQLIKVNGTKQKIVPKDKRNFKLPEMYNILNCRIIQFVRTKKGKLMVIDEEGKLKEDWIDNINTEATKLYVHGELDPIVGDVLICQNKEIK